MGPKKLPIEQGRKKPLFRDRHEIRGLTAEDVAQAHKIDLEVQSCHFCKALTFWYDESRGTVFCLFDALSATADSEMHQDAHGLIPNFIMEVDASTVAQFLGRIATETVVSCGSRMALRELPSV